MPRHLWIIGLTLLGTAGATTFDVATFTVPPAYTSTSTQGTVQLTKIVGSGYCVLAVYSSVKSAGTLNADFQQEWQSLVVKAVRPGEAPQVEAGTARDGWANTAGAAAYQQDNGARGIALLSTYSGFGRRLSVMMLANDESCLNDLDTFLGGLTLTRPAGATTAPKPSPPPSKTPAATPVRSAFAFNTTTFDDGWVSVEQKDWVLARKGNVTVYLHHPQEVTTRYYSDSLKGIAAAWNTLVAPRYSAVQGLKQDYNSMTYQRPHLAAATATSRELGKQVYVTLFEQDTSGWIEVVTPDRQTFVQTFGIDIDRMDDYLGNEPWAKLRALRGLNRFAVSAADLTGTWSSNFTGMTQYVNIFTGLSAGATAHSSNQTFAFSPGGRYAWSLATATGVVGAQTFQGAKSAGTLTMKGNWQVNFSDIEKKPALYNAYFEVGQGGSRILWLQDTSYGDYTPYVQVK